MAEVGPHLHRSAAPTPGSAPRSSRPDRRLAGASTRRSASSQAGSWRTPGFHSDRSVANNRHRRAAGHRSARSLRGPDRGRRPSAPAPHCSRGPADRDPAWVPLSGRPRQRRPSVQRLSLRRPGCARRRRDGGSTDSCNLCGLCWHHHRLVHEGGWSITGSADHELAFRSFTGASCGPDPRASAPPPAATSEALGQTLRR